MYSDGKDWQLHPIAGATGDAYMGVRSNEKIFLKRNTSPFIAALAAEELTPKLMWTQRTFSGDTLTAQEWTDGHILSKDAMGQQEVIDLIHQYHHSDHLLILLKRVGGKEMAPLDLITLYFENLPKSLQNHQYLNRVVQYLEDCLDSDFYQIQPTICHGDLNHNNFLKSHDGKLYLVDWDNVRISDSLSDITYLLVNYFKPSQWMDWFDRYNYPITDSFYKRVKWYSLLNCLYIIKHYYKEGRQHRTNEFILKLKAIMENQ